MPPNGSLAELNAWFRALSPDEKRDRGEAFNAAKKAIAAKRPAPPRIAEKSGRWVRVALTLNPNSAVVDAGLYVSPFRDIFVPDPPDGR